MKKPETAAAAANGSMPDAGFLSSYPMLSEFLTHDKYDDGSARERSALSVKVQDGMILVCVQDHDLSRSLFVVGATLPKALAAAEKAVSGPGADWRAWKAFKKKK